MRPLSGLIVALCVVAPLVARGDELRLPSGTSRASAKISERAIRSATAELASDAYEGRSPGSPGPT